VELCAPYGQLVQTKLAVGPNRWNLVMHISLLSGHLSLLHCPGILSSAQQGGYHTGTRPLWSLRTSVRLSRWPRITQTALIPPRCDLNTVLPCASCLTGSAVLQGRSFATKHIPSLITTQVRGKTVFLQYSLRQEITNARGNDTASNVLLVAVDNLAVRTQMLSGCGEKAW